MKKKFCLLLAVVFLFVFCAGCHEMSDSEILYKEVEEGKYPNLTVYQDVSGFKSICYNMYLNDLVDRLSKNGLQIIDKSPPGIFCYINLKSESYYIFAEYEEKNSNYLNYVRIKFREKPSVQDFNDAVELVALTLDDTLTEEQLQKMKKDIIDLRGASPTVSMNDGTPEYKYSYSRPVTLNNMSISLQNTSTDYKSINFSINYSINEIK